MVSRFIRIVLTALAVAGFASSAQATTFDYEFELSAADCDAMDWGCDGSSLFLGVREVSGGWEITYTVDTNGPDGYNDDRDGINQVGFKAISGWDVDFSTVIGPDEDLSWSLVEATTNSSTNSPCDPEVGDPTDKVCSNGFVDITDDGTYTWEYFLAGGTLIDTEDWHLGGQYADGGGRSRGQIWSTEGGPPVPEPTAAVLFGLGAILVARRTQRS